MKFIALSAIIKDEFEEKAISVAKSAGAGSVTIVRGQNIPLEAKKIFMGLTYEESVSILIFILPLRLSLKVMKAIKIELNLDKEENGLVFTLPISHVAGLNIDEVHKFEEDVKHTL